MSKGPASLDIAAALDIKDVNIKRRGLIWARDVLKSRSRHRSQASIDPAMMRGRQTIRARVISDTVAIDSSHIINSSRLIKAMATVPDSIIITITNSNNSISRLSQITTSGNMHREAKTTLSISRHNRLRTFRVLRGRILLLSSCSLSSPRTVS